jgi:hypothetical protein
MMTLGLILPGEHTRLACWFRRLAETHFAEMTGEPELREKSLRLRGRNRQHARRVRSPNE